MNPLREIVTDTLRFWERSRLVYNGVLTAAAIFMFLFGHPAHPVQAALEMSLPLFFLAVVANVLYSSAHVVDVFVQLSDFREAWRKYRWRLLLLGTVFALALEYGVMLGFANAGDF